MIEWILTFIAYGAIILAIVLYFKDKHTECNQNCRQGRNCNCEDKENG